MIHWAGFIRLVATGLPAGLGSYVSWDTKLDAKLAAAAAMYLGFYYSRCRRYFIAAMDNLAIRHRDGKLLQYSLCLVL